MFKYSYTSSDGKISACKIYILHSGNVKYIGFEDIDEGDLVTNSIDRLATSIVRQNDWDPKDCLFFVWYLYKNKKGNKTVDEIEYNWDKDKTATLPRWKKYCSLEDNPFKK